MAKRSINLSPIHLPLPTTDAVTELKKGRETVDMLEQMGFLSPQEAQGMREFADRDIALAKKNSIK